MLPLANSMVIIPFAAELDNDVLKVSQESGAANLPYRTCISRASKAGMNDPTGQKEGLDVMRKLSENEGKRTVGSPGNAETLQWEAHARLVIGINIRLHLSLKHIPFMDTSNKWYPIMGMKNPPSLSKTPSDVEGIRVLWTLYEAIGTITTTDTLEIWKPVKNKRIKARKQSGAKSVFLCTPQKNLESAEESGVHRRPPRRRIWSPQKATPQKNLESAEESGVLLRSRYESAEGHPAEESGVRRRKWSPQKVLLRNRPEILFFKINGRIGSPQRGKAVRRSSFCGIGGPKEIRLNNQAMRRVGYTKILERLKKRRKYTDQCYAQLQ
ncbi:hypothetical protein LXL04_015201 [Taraxacum kok-saghyz]